MREFGSEHPAITLPDGYFDTFIQFNREITYLRSGREALLYVALNCNRTKPATILLPAYCCWSMIAPFEKTGWHIIYYKLNEDLTANEDYLLALCNNYHPNAILTINYFGSASTSQSIALIKKFDSSIIIIEDFSHCTFCLKTIFDKNVDYYVSSIRKSVGVCDGSVVLSKQSTNKCFISLSEDNIFSHRRFIAQIDKWHYSFNKNITLKDSFLSTFHECENIINEFMNVKPISRIATQMLSLVNGGNIAYVRRENMKHLWERIEGKVESIVGLERSFNGAPFSLPILVNDRDKVQKKLAERGVYAPVLWTLDQTAQKTCAVSRYMSEHMLSIPIDQRYDWDDIEDIYRIIMNCI